MAYILMVDDDADLAETTATVMRSKGLEVGIELDTAGALMSIEKRTPDLIILDVMFPENKSAGFEMARQLRSNQKYMKVPILMLTAVNEKFPFGFSKSDIDEEWLPVTDFLEKPVDFDVLSQKIMAMLPGQA